METDAHIPCIDVVGFMQIEQSPMVWTKYHTTMAMSDHNAGSFGLHPAFMPLIPTANTVADNPAHRHSWHIYCHEVTARSTSKTFAFQVHPHFVEEMYLCIGALLLAD